MFQTTWLTLVGLSLLFVGGFVLWVYGTRAPHVANGIKGPEAEATRAFYKGLVHWFLLYGTVAVFAGAGCLLTGMMIAM